MDVTKQLQYGMAIENKINQLSRRFLDSEDKDEQRRIAYCSLLDMYVFLQTVELPGILPICPSEFYRYGDNLGIFSFVRTSLLGGHYKRACNALSDMLDSSYGNGVSYFYINQLRCLLEEWAGVQGMFTRQQRVAQMLREVKDDEVRRSYNYALSRVDSIVGNNEADKISLLMQIIRNDIKFSRIAGILKESQVRPTQVDLYIPVCPLDEEVTTKTISSANVDITISPYDARKFRDAITDMAAAPFDPNLNHHDGIYWPELGLAVMRNGIHHSAIGLTRGEFITMEAEVVPLTPWFDRLETDGVTWTIRGEGGVRTEKVLDFRFAVLFELAKRAAKV